MRERAHALRVCVKVCAYVSVCASVCVCQGMCMYVRV